MRRLITTVLTIGVAGVTRNLCAEDMAVENKIQSVLREAGAQGAVCLVDVRSGKTLACAGSGLDPNAPLLPLSAIKLYIASMWYDLMPAKRGLRDPKAGGVTMDDVLVVGYDAPGEEAAIALRKMLGTKRMLEGLGTRGLGLPPGKLELDEKTDDKQWGKTLSIGEINVTITLEQMAHFLRQVGQSASPSAKNLQLALRECVARGSASSVAHRLDGIDWSIGGKTGTGPASAAPNYDGCFAGLIYKDADARYAFAIYIQGKGKGGGVAASVAADLAKWFATTDVAGK